MYIDGVYKSWIHISIKYKVGKWVDARRQHTFPSTVVVYLDPKQKVSWESERASFKSNGFGVNDMKENENKTELKLSIEYNM